MAIAHTAAANLNVADRVEKLWYAFEVVHNFNDLTVLACSEEPLESKNLIAYPKDSNF